MRWVHAAISTRLLLGKNCVLFYRSGLYYSITFSDNSFINPVCAYSVFERSTGKEWHNPSRNSSDARGDSFEQSRIGLGNLKTRTLRQQLTIIYSSRFRSAYSSKRERERERDWERESVRVSLPDLPLPFIPTLIGLRAFDLVSSRVWWEAATNIGSMNRHKEARPRPAWQNSLNADF